MARTRSSNGCRATIIGRSKSDTYYDKDSVQIDEVYYYVQDDLAAAFTRYRAGEYDILTDMPGDQQQFVKDTMPGEGRFARSWASTTTSSTGKSRRSTTSTSARRCRWRSIAT